MKFGAVIVFYNPDQKAIENAVKLSRILDTVVIDNSAAITNYSRESINIISQGVNKGLAAALNIGIRYLKEQGKDFAFLFDQDSRPNDNLINSLSKAASIADIKTALLAPVYYETQLKRLSSIVKIKSIFMRKSSPTGSTPISAAYAITSGSCIRISAFDDIGYKDENLFIDLVDIEWCQRASRKGYKILILPNAVMEHTLGDSSLKVLNWSFAIHAPVRHYYRFRNAIYLLKLKHIAFIWKVREVIRLGELLVLFSCFGNQKIQHIKHMTKGLKDGFLGRMGPISD